METLVAIMLAISCPRGDTTCHKIAAPQLAYETIDHCRTDLTLLLLKRIEVHLLFVTFLPIDPDKLVLDAEVVWEITAPGELTSEVYFFTAQSADLQSSQIRTKKSGTIHSAKRFYLRSLTEVMFQIHFKPKGDNLVKAALFWILGLPLPIVLVLYFLGYL